MKKNSNSDAGLTIVECVIALFLTTIAIFTLINMQPLAWQGAGKSDYLGRAAAILQRELEINEYEIMKGVVPPNSKSCVDKDGKSVDCTDASAMYSIIITTSKPATIPDETTLLNVRVTWPETKRGVASSIIVSPQGKF